MPTDAIRPPSKVEFAVQMTCQKCVRSVEDALSGLDGISNVQIDLANNSVVVDSNVPSTVILDMIESTGRKAVLKGYGSSSQLSAVAMLGYPIGSGSIMGVVRFHQVGTDQCVVDGTIDGLSPGYHGLHVHECGDLSNGCTSVGGHYNPKGASHGGPEDDHDHRHAGDIGNIFANDKGRADFRLLDKVLKVDEIIGRSIVVTSNIDDLGKGPSELSKIDGNSGSRLSCGIIARASGLFSNPKQICACSGQSLWDERGKRLN